MALVEAHPDVLVLGDHPCTYLAAALLRENSTLRVLHSVAPKEGDWPKPSSTDHLVEINPALFDLHKCLQPLRRKLNLSSIYGIKFLSDDPAVHNEHRSKSMLGLVGYFRELQLWAVDLAKESGVKLISPRTLEIQRLDETGLDILIDGQPIRPTAMVLGCELPHPQASLLGLGESWDREVIHQFSTATLPRGITADLGSRPLMPMSLDLKKTLGWAWMLQHEERIQISVMQRIGEAEEPNPVKMLEHWVGVLRAHNILVGKGRPLGSDDVCSSHLPLAGAMAHEGVANRTLLIGPGGGFYSACAEDIYPNCWSAVFAAAAMRSALKEKHLQDALQHYRQVWRTTLGDYLRGPQQNLRFLLPLIYRNSVMATRLCESILLGKSVVR
ncbi:MAG: hypothetical protein M3O30_02980 [Planctomycetota bacterium]|nr:hypothetical protein [Planctomycetota bacterium]